MSKSEVRQYRKKPVVIEAVELTNKNELDVLHWINGGKEGGGIGQAKNGHVYIATLEGNMKANYGDYIIRGIKGEFYPCKPDIFEETYELTPQKERDE